MAKVGRNETCPCGSGKKYKHCCESKVGGSVVQSRVIMLLIAAAIVAAILAGFSNRGSRTGGVWSAEHGHYHDANGRETAR